MRRRFGRSVFLRMLILVPALAMLSSPANAGSCSQVQLKDASGVIGKVHRYTFSAVCSWSWTESKKSFSVHGFESSTKNFGIDMNVLGEGKWDRVSGKATEKVKVNGHAAVKGPSGSFAGVRLASGICNQDPFLKDPPGAAAVCHSMEVIYEGTSGPIFEVLISPKKFLLEKRIFLAEAQALSAKKSASAPPPPPPPPKPAAKPDPAKVARTARGVLASKPAAPPEPPPQRPAAPAAGGGAPARQNTAQIPGMPDITSAPGVVVGARNVQWGGIVSVNASEARRVNDGVCDFAIRHTVKNESATPAGGFSRRWTNSNVAGTWEMSYPSIPANGTFERVDTLPLKPGRNVLYLTLDSGNGVAESNESNNLFRVAVDLAGACGPASNSPAPGASSTPPKAGDGSSINTARKGASLMSLPLLRRSSMTIFFSRTAALLFCVLLLAGAIAASDAHAAGATAKGGLKVAVEAAQKWQADAVLTSVSAMKVGADGKAAKWDYMFFSPKTRKAYSVDVKNNKVAGTLEVNPHIKDGVGEFVDSDKAIEEAKKNGLKGKPDVMSLIVMGQATKNPACYWSIVSQTGSVLFSFVIDGKSGKFSYKQETKM